MDLNQQTRSGMNDTSDSKTGGRRRYDLVMASLLRRGPQVLSLVAFLAIWEILGRRVNPILFATPTAVVRSLISGFVQGDLAHAFLWTCAGLMCGFALACVVGISLGVIMGRRTLVHRVLNPYVDFFQATPLVGLTPLVVVWFGLGFSAEVFLSFLLTVWVLVVNTVEGVRNTPRMLLDMAAVFHVAERGVIFRIAIPHALPYIFAGLRVGFARSLIGVILAQMMISLKGLGGLIRNNGDAFDTSALLAAVLASSLIGVIGVWILEAARQRFVPWADSK